MAVASNKQEAIGTESIRKHLNIIIKQINQSIQTNQVDPLMITKVAKNSKGTLKVLKANILILLTCTLTL